MPNSVPTPDRLPLTPFEEFGQRYPDVVKRIEQVKDHRFYLYGALLTAYFSKRLSSSPLKGFVSGVAVVPLSLAADRLLTRRAEQPASLDPPPTDGDDAALAAALAASVATAEPDRKALELLERFKNVLPSHLQLKSVPDDGRCLFHAAALQSPITPEARAVDPNALRRTKRRKSPNPKPQERAGDQLCHKVLAALKKEPTVQEEFHRPLDLVGLEDNDVLADIAELADSGYRNIRTAIYCQKMTQKKSKTSYPLPGQEIFPALQHVTGRSLLVFSMHISPTTTNPLQTFGDFKSRAEYYPPFTNCIEPKNPIMVVFCCRHYWAIVPKTGAS